MPKAVSNAAPRLTRKSPAGLGLLTASLFACVAAAGIAFAADGAKPASPIPDFSSHGEGWVGDLNDFTPPESGPGPVTFDPAHPYVGDHAGSQPTLRVADLNNPNLKPWVKDALKKVNDQVLAGKLIDGPQVRCWPPGIMGALLLRVLPIYFIQTPNEVWILIQQDHQVRHVYLNKEHAKNLKPTWYGESVGHYDGDTLVVDTIGLSTKTFVDNYRTPHSEQLHIVERYRVVDSGKSLQIKVMVDDPGAFNQPWNAVQTLRRVQQGPLAESACAENINDYFNLNPDPFPQDDRPDF